MKMLPEQYIKHHAKQKNYVDIINGHRVLFRTLDEETKARSLNLSAFWIEEANTVAYEYFVQLQTRLRNTATTKHIGILSSNPDANWIKTEFLLKSKHIHNSEITYHQDPLQINSQFSTHIASTSLNTYLPPNFYEDTARGKEKWWIERYLHGSFQNKEGRVYPMFEDHIVEPFPVVENKTDRYGIPMHWERVFGGDFGLRHATVLLGGAIDPSDGTLYIYAEHYDSEKPVSYHAGQMRRMLDRVPSGRLRSLVGDPKGASKSERDMRSIFDHYAEYGIYFSPATNKIIDGIMKVYNYFALGKLKIFSSCVNLIREGKDYKYPERSLDDKKEASEKPIDKDDHTLDSLKYIIAELPDNPEDLINRSYGLTYTNEKKEQAHLPHALQDDDDTYSQGDWYNSY
jgi:PBSX family phage terminase large subunit